MIWLSKVYINILTAEFAEYTEKIKIIIIKSLLSQRSLRTIKAF
jgi:hypothetical protein